MASPSSKYVYSNKTMHQKCFEILVKDTSDVNFICDDGTIKLPAHRCVLAASSSVFNAMFNGPLNEKGDVEIVDASAAVFKEFLQLFYDEQIELTMDNIDGVMKLIDKYDVEDGWSICEKFLMNSLKIDDMLWGLYLGFRFGRDELLDFCMDIIQRNIDTIYKMIMLNENGSPKLRPNMNQRSLSDANLAVIFPLIQNKIGNGQKNARSSVQMDIRNFSSSLTTGEFDKMYQLEDTQELELQSFNNSNLLLTRIDLSPIFTNGPRTKYTVGIWFLNDSRQKLNFMKADIGSGITSCYLNASFIEESYRLRYLFVKILSHYPPLYTYGSNILSPTLREIIPNRKVNLILRSKVSLVHSLHFKTRDF